MYHRVVSVQGIGSPKSCTDKDFWICLAALVKNTMVLFETFMSPICRMEVGGLRVECSFNQQ